VIPALGADPGAPFPRPEQALEQPDGLLAWGGDLEPRRLERAYRSGIFPWYSDGEPILWWSPARRCVLPTDDVHCPRRLARLLRQGRFRLTMDRDFAGVVDGCIEARDSTWITPEMRAAYLRMHALGHGHSVEAWLDEELAGGLYGLAFGRLFCGESMFSRRRDASKVVLVTLCRALHHWNFPWLDCQVSNPHLERMGARELSREVYLARLPRLLAAQEAPGSWAQRFASWQETQSATRA